MTNALYNLPLMLCQQEFNPEFSQNEYVSSVINLFYQTISKHHFITDFLIHKFNN